MQLCNYLSRNQVLHVITDVINSHLYQAVAVLSGKTNELMGQSCVLLVVWHDFNICMNRQLATWGNWTIIFMDVNIRR